MSQIQKLKRVRHGVYNVNGMNGQKAIIKGAGNIKLGNGEVVKDTLLNRFNITNVVYGEINKCNIIDKYLLSNKKLPVLYVSVVYEKPLVRDVLFTIFLYFTITDDIKNENELINKEINGLFSVEMMMNKSNTVIESDISKNGYVNDDTVIENIKEMIFSSEIKPIIEGLITIKDEERRKRILDMYPGQIKCEPPKVSYKFDDLL
jgi:hypothetical protein